MGRKKLLDPPVELRISLPTSLYVQLSLLLHSDTKGRVPYGAFSQFFVLLLERHFRKNPPKESKEPTNAA